MESFVLEKHEKWTLLGLFLIMLAVFLPWYVVRFEGAELPWNETVSGNVYGHMLFFGHLFLLLAAINFVTVLYTKRKEETSETFIAKSFLIGLITFVFVFNVLGVFFTSVGSFYFSPHIGILFLLFGILMVIVGLKKNYNKIK